MVLGYLVVDCCSSSCKCEFPLGRVAAVAIEQNGLGDRLLMVREVAELMRVSNMTVYRLIKAGDLPALRVGKNFRIRRSDVEGYLSGRSFSA